jgi:hypothetical protein
MVTICKRVEFRDQAVKTQLTKQRCEIQPSLGAFYLEGGRLHKLRRCYEVFLRLLITQRRQTERVAVVGPVSLFCQASALAGLRVRRRQMASPHEWNAHQYQDLRAQSRQLYCPHGTSTARTQR